MMSRVKNGSQSRCHLWSVMNCSAAVESQLEENRQRARQGKRGAKYLLQGLLVCDCCGHSYYGKSLSPSARKNKPRNYAYYRCIGSDAYRFGGERLCYNKQVRTTD